MKCRIVGTRTLKEKLSGKVKSKQNGRYRCWLRLAVGAVERGGTPVAGRKAGCFLKGVIDCHENATSPDFKIYFFKN